MEVRDDLHAATSQALRAAGTKMAALQEQVAALSNELAQYKQLDQGRALATKMASSGALVPDFQAVDQKAQELSQLTPDELAIHEKAVELYGGVAVQDGFAKVAADPGSVSTAFDESPNNEEALAAFRSGMGWG